MDRDRFISLRFRAFMEVDYIHDRLPNGYLTCMLVAIDFDNDVVKLLPLPGSDYEEKEFWVSIDYFDLPKKRLRILTTP